MFLYFQIASDKKRNICFLNKLRVFFLIHFQYHIENTKKKYEMYSTLKLTDIEQVKVCWDDIDAKLGPETKRNKLNIVMAKIFTVASWLSFMTTYIFQIEINFKSSIGPLTFHFLSLFNSVAKNIVISQLIVKS